MHLTRTIAQAKALWIYNQEFGRDPESFHDYAEMEAHYRSGDVCGLALAYWPVSQQVRYRFLDSRPRPNLLTISVQASIASDRGSPVETKAMSPS